MRGHPCSRVHSHHPVAIKNDCSVRCLSLWSRVDSVSHSVDKRKITASSYKVHLRLHSISKAQPECRMQEKYRGEGGCTYSFTSSVMWPMVWQLICFALCLYTFYRFLIFGGRGLIAPEMYLQRCRGFKTNRQNLAVPDFK